MKELSLHILDIVQNSIRANAQEIAIRIDDSASENEFRIEVCDDGKGMNDTEMEQALSPYFTSRTTRRVGLGIPLLKQNAEMTGGSLQIDTAPGKGCQLSATFIRDHLDRPPLGNLSSTLILLLVSNPNLHFKFNYQTDQGIFQLDSVELKSILDSLSLEHKEIRDSVENYIRSNLTSIL